MPAAPDDLHRVIRCGLVQVRCRGVPLIQELALFISPALDPGLLGNLPCPLCNGFLKRVYGGELITVDIQIFSSQQRQKCQMHMRVDESRHQRPAPQVNHLRLGANCRLYLFRSTHHADLIA